MSEKEICANNVTGLKSNTEATNFCAEHKRVKSKGKGQNSKVQFKS